MPRDDLERRYDGPIPPNASVSADADAPWHVQVANRRHLAWREVRRLAITSLNDYRELQRNGSVSARRHSRLSLKHALQTWRYWFDQDRHLTVMRTSPSLTEMYCASLLARQGRG